MFRCEKCNLELDTFNWRLILSVNIVDMTDNQWVQCFQEQGEDILGVKAQELGDLFVSGKEAYEKVFEVITQTLFLFFFVAKPSRINPHLNTFHCFVD
jgi:replication factor A1